MGQLEKPQTAQNKVNELKIEIRKLNKTLEIICTN